MLPLKEKTIKKNGKQLLKNVGQEISVTFIDRAREPDLRGLFFSTYNTAFGTIVSVSDSRLTLRSSKNRNQFDIPVMDIAGFVILPKLPVEPYLHWQGWRDHKKKLGAV